MFVSGFTIVRNARRFDYPVIESIRSMLPLCDEVLVAVGKSDDDTLQMVQSIADPRIRIIETVWDDALREGGQVLAVETDKALAATNPEATWCLYLQADEVLHEADYPNIRAAMQRHATDQTCEGLLFKYRHFTVHTSTSATRDNGIETKFVSFGDKIKQPRTAMLRDFGASVKNFASEASKHIYITTAGYDIPKNNSSAFSISNSIGIPKIG